MLDCQRHKFKLPEGKVFLNGAYMSPQLNSVSLKGIEAVMTKSDPFQTRPEHFFEESEAIRKAFSQLINCAEPQRCVLIPSVSYGMANVAKNLPTNKRKIILTANQFPSNVYLWMKMEELGNHQVHFVAVPKDMENRAAIWNDRILKAIDADTAMVAIGHIHWADGSKFDLKSIRKRCDEAGALLVIDGTQSVGALPFSVEDIKPDALVCAGYKWLMGPYGLGMAYYGPYFDEGKPIEENWINRKNSDDFAALVHYEKEYLPKALRYEMGEHSQFILLPMLHEAIKQLLEWTPEAIQNYCANLMKEAKQEWRAIGYQLQKDELSAHHLFGIQLKPTDDLNQLKALMDQYHISLSIRGNILRISPNVYNDKDDVNQLTKMLKAYYKA